MYKRLRIIVPAAQLLLIVALFGLKSVFYVKGYYEINNLLRVLIQTLNYPVWAVFIPIVVQADKWLRPLPEWLGKGLAFALAALIPVAIALLWYLVVTEIEMRRHGKSILRFSGWWKELLAVTMLFLFGAGAFIKAYRIGSTIVHRRIPDIRLLLAIARWDEILGMLILTAWGIVLTGVAIQDLRIFFKNRGHGAPPAGSL